MHGAQASSTSISGSSPTVTEKRIFKLLSVRTVQGASLPAVVEGPGGSDDAGPHDEGRSKGPGHASG